MDSVCSRCHKPLQGEDCYCPACGLPQLVFAADGSTDQASSEPWDKVVRDAGQIEWKPALRASLTVAVPAGLLCSELSALGGFAFWMISAAALAVVLYVRSERPAWITAGAGARIGLATGMIAAWVTFAVSGATLFAQRYLLHQSAQMDTEWRTRVTMGQQLAAQFTSGLSGADPAQVKAAQEQFQAWMLSPEGHAGMEALRLAFDAGFLLLFAVLGGLLGARIIIRRTRPQV